MPYAPHTLLLVKQFREQFQMVVNLSLFWETL
jgi:hypothetical protein